MLSEDEWNEQNGEDIIEGGNDMEDEEEKKIIEELNIEAEEDQSFIVSDSYLSASELNLT